jgi:hypothetical protein
VRGGEGLPETNAAVRPAGDIGAGARRDFDFVGLGDNNVGVRIGADKGAEKDEVARGA